MAPPVDPRAKALAAVRWPALALQILAGLMALQILGTGALVAVEAFHVEPWNEGADDAFFFFAVVSSLVLGLGAALLVFVSGRRIARLRGPRLATVSAVLLMIPCLSGYCWLLAVPVGIWLLFAIRQPHVKPWLDAPG